MAHARTTHWFLDFEGTCNPDCSSSQPFPFFPLSLSRMTDHSGSISLEIPAIQCLAFLLSKAMGQMSLMHWVSEQAQSGRQSQRCRSGAPFFPKTWTFRGDIHTASRSKTPAQIATCALGTGERNAARSSTYAIVPPKNIKNHMLNTTHLIQSDWAHDRTHPRYQS